MSKEKTLWDANNVVNNHIYKKSEEALGRVEQELHGEGCGCRNCVTSAVNDVNMWVGFMVNGRQDADQFRFGVEVENGKAKVKRSRSWIKNERY